MNTKRLKTHGIITSLFRALFVSFLLVGTMAHALDLHSAKQQGLVGETANGYLAVVKPGGGAAALVAKINAQRKAQYQRIAAKNKISVSDVEALAGKKAVERTARGQYIRVGGSWRKK